MKFATLVILAGLLAIAAGEFALPKISADNSYEIDADYLMDTLDEASEYVDVETQGIFKSFKKFLKNTLRTVKGINCTIKAVLNVQSATVQFVNEVNACGGIVSKRLQEILDACNKIIDICNDIININDNVCGLGPDSDSSTIKNAHECAKQLYKKICQLKKQIKHTLKLIKKLPNSKPEVNDCVQTAVNKLTEVLTGFPGYIKECSKLTSDTYRK